MISDLYMDTIDELMEAVDNCKFEDKEEVRSFVCNLTKLVYDYKMMGKLYDFYLEDVEYHKQNRRRIHGVVDLVHNVLDMCAEFPDLKTDIENVIVYKVDDTFYKVFRRLRYKGTNSGYSKYGPPTGKSLGDNCLNLSLMHLKKVDGQWKFVFEVNCDSEGWIKEVQTQ
ncbi:MAG: hypothetical protein K0S71_2276 [Clostridia bacterium]|nr:hypothetical protein [Clostridia bacterium]